MTNSDFNDLARRADVLNLLSAHCDSCNEQRRQAAQFVALERVFKCGELKESEKFYLAGFIMEKFGQ